MLERARGLSAFQGGRGKVGVGRTTLLAVILIAGAGLARADDTGWHPSYASETRDARDVVAQAPSIETPSIQAPSIEAPGGDPAFRWSAAAKPPASRLVVSRHRAHRGVSKDVPTRYGTAKSVAGLSAGSVTLTGPQRLFEELHCLALNIYFEARGEDRKGQQAVAHVVMNRVEDRRFPETVCDVVRQGGEAVLHRCQFSWWCDGQSDRPKNLALWRTTKAIAQAVYWGYSVDPTKGALWYHADYVMPHWGRVFKRGPKIGRHIFYVADEKGLYLAANHTQP